MKLQIKTLNRKTLSVEIDEEKTVHDLKRDLSYYADVGVKPELQELIYMGDVMRDELQLSTYKIDTSKFLVVMTLKETGLLSAANRKSDTVKNSSIGVDNKPKENVGEPVKEEITKPQENDTKANTSANTGTITKSDTNSNAGDITTIDKALVEQIVNMGYEEQEVRRALAASYNNAERAIEYLVEGMPTSSEMATAALVDSYSDGGNETISPFEMFRKDPVFRQLRNAVHQNPELADKAVDKIAANYPGLREMIAEYQDEFLSALINDSNDENDDDDDDDDNDDGDNVVN